MLFDNNKNVLSTLFINLNFELLYFFFLKSTLGWSFEGRWKMFKIDASQVCCKEKQVWLY